MSAFQLTTIVGIPLAVLFVAVVLLGFARPDRDEDHGIYASYLALASVFSLYVGVLAVAALGEAIGQHLAVGDDPSRDLMNDDGVWRTYFQLVANGGPSTIAAFATLTALMAGVFTYHARRRRELAAAEHPHLAIARIDRAYRASVCFAMVSLIAIGALVAGSAGYDFLAEPVGSSGEFRDQSMATLLAFGGLVLAAGLVLRANLWAMRGGAGEAEGEPELADLEDVR